MEQLTARYDRLQEASGCGDEAEVARVSRGGGHRRRPSGLRCWCCAWGSSGCSTGRPHALHAGVRLRRPGPPAVVDSPGV